MRTSIAVGLSILGTILVHAAQAEQRQPAPAKPKQPAAEQPAPADVPVRRNLLVNQVGYLPRGAKFFVVEGLEPGSPETFSLVNVDLMGKWAVFSGKLRRVAGDFGSYHVGDFSEWASPGQYVLETRTPGGAGILSYVFRIADDVYDDAIQKGVHFHAVQRCGPSTTGYHAPCHLDDAVRKDNGQYLDLVGGWHNSSDLLKWSGPSLMSMHGLLNVAALASDAELKKRILDEVRWGNLYFHKLQDPAGYVYSHGVGGDAPSEGNHWTDNIRGTADDRRAVTRQARLGEQHAFIWAQALTALAAGPSDPEYAKECLQRAERCFAWVVQHQSMQSDSRAWPSDKPTADATYYDLGAGISAGLHLARASGQQKHREYAVGMADRFMALQEREYVGGQREVRGFFYTAADRKEGVSVGIVEPLCLIALSEILEALPKHPKAAAWREAIQMHARDYVSVMARRNAFALVPRGMALAEATRPNPFSRDGIPRNRKIGQLGYRYFPGASGGARNCYHAGLAVALFKAARLLDQPDWAAIAQRQLDWILGENPFGVSFMVGAGRVHPPEYIYTGFQPRTPWIPGATLQGVFGDRFDRPDLLPGHFLSAEYWTLHSSFLIWGLAQAKASCE